MKRKEKREGQGKETEKGEKEGQRVGKGTGTREGNNEDSEGTLMRSRVYRYTKLHCNGRGAQGP